MIALPDLYRIVGTGDPIEEGNCVEFRLLYSGPLLGASRNSTRASEKHELRRAFHPQLRRLWETHRSLAQLADRWSSAWVKQHPNEPIPPGEHKNYGIRAIGEQWDRFGFHFVPLITEQFVLRCRLDILFLRPEETPFVMQSGDLDARLKTLFDALRIPDHLAETGGVGPEPDEDPFYCLLQDDKMISEINVVTDQLLVLPQQRQPKANDAFLVIHVTINHATAGTFDRYF